MAKSPWKDEMIILIYEYAKAGMIESNIAKAIGVNANTLEKWKTTRPIVAFALKRGRGKHKEDKKQKTITFHEYVYNRLSPELQEVWDRIMACETHKNGIAQIEALLRDVGKNGRQHLFLHALIARNFSVSDACHAVNITRNTFENWKNHDPGFADLIEELHQAKKDFFESALVNAVKAGEPAAVIFANKTFNRDRGYHDKVDVNVTGTVKHEHAVYLMDDLPLPLEVQKQILHAIRQRKKNDPQAIGYEKKNLPEITVESVTRDESVF